MELLQALPAEQRAAVQLHGATVQVHMGADKSSLHARSNGQDGVRPIATDMEAAQALA